MKLNRSPCSEGAADMDQILWNTEAEHHDIVNGQKNQLVFFHSRHFCTRHNWKHWSVRTGSQWWLTGTLKLRSHIWYILKCCPHSLGFKMYLCTHKNTKNDPTRSTRHAGLVGGESPLRKQYVKHQRRTFWSSWENFSVNKMIQNDRTALSEVVNLKLDLKLKTNWSSTVAVFRRALIKQNQNRHVWIEVI